MSGKKDEEGRRKLVQLCGEFHIEAIAVGNGTAGRETEALVRSLPLAPFPPSLQPIW